MLNNYYIDLLLMRINRLAIERDMNAPEIIINQEIKLIKEACDFLLTTKNS